MIDESQKLQYIDIDSLELWEDANVRKHDPMENIDELSNNIKQNGLRVPLLVKGKNARGKYGVFSGQRRLMACAKAGKQKIPCFVFEGIKLADARVLSLSENLYRLSMDYKDKSNAAKQLLRHFKSREKVAAALGVDISTIKRYLGYDALPDEVKALVAQKKISSTKAVDIFSKFVDEAKVIKIANELASIPLTEKKKRRSISFAIDAARKTDTVGDIREAAKTIEEGVQYTILLPNRKSKTIEKIASVRLSTKEDIATEMLLERIREYESGENR